MEITKGERAALGLIVGSGRAVVEVGLVLVPADDGRVSASGHQSRRLDRFVGHFAILAPGEAEPMDATTAEGLERRGLIKTWAVGLVGLIDRDRRLVGARPVVLATLTPAAAAELGVRITEGGDGMLRWTDEPDDPSPVTPPPEVPYPEPFAEIAPLPKPRPRSRRRAKKAG